jgi:hypothetical protein
MWAVPAHPCAHGISDSLQVKWTGPRSDSDLVHPGRRTVQTAE